MIAIKRVPPLLSTLARVKVLLERLYSSNWPELEPEELAFRCVDSIRDPVDVLLDPFPGCLRVYSHRHVLRLQLQMMLLSGVDVAVVGPPGQDDHGGRQFSSRHADA